MKRWLVRKMYKFSITRKKSRINKKLSAIWNNIRKIINKNSRTSKIPFKLWNNNKKNINKGSQTCKKYKLKNNMKIMIKVNIV